MKAIYLLITNGILSIVLSQFDNVGIDSWDKLPGTTFPTPDNEDCEQIGAFDFDSNKIKLFGGVDGDVAYTFDPDTRTFINESSIGVNITVKGVSWVVDNTAGSIYYRMGGEIRAIDVATGVDQLFAALDGTIDQLTPGLCIDESTQTVYSVGTQEIETCTSSGCTAKGQEPLKSQETPLENIACAFYNDKVYTFGGQIGSDIGDGVELIFECDANVTDSCTQIGTLTTGHGRGGIRAQRIDCFNDQFLALLGGRDGVANFAVTVELFDLDNLAIQRIVSLSGARAGAASVFDPITEQIWLFGGIDSDVAAEQCSQEIDVSVTTTPGICFTPDPTMDPTADPTNDPTSNPTTDPTFDPTSDPTMDPTKDPTTEPTPQPSNNPSMEPTTAAPVTAQPTSSPGATPEPTKRPTTTTTYEPITEGYTTSGSAYGVVIGLLIAICCIIAICAFWYSKEEKDHVYGRMEQGAAAVVAGGGGGAVPMVAAGAGYGGYEQPKAAAAGGYDNGTAATGYTQSTDQKY